MARNRVLWILLAFLFILLIVLLCVGSSQNSRLSQVTPSPTASGPKLRYEGEGVAYGIQETRQGKYWRTYQVSGHSSFRGFFWLLNQQPAEEYLITCLVDYQQVPCVFDGQQRLLYRVDMGDFEDQTVPFETPPLVPGFHDVALLAFAKPNVHDLSRKYRFSTDFHYLYAPRLVLLTGDEPWQVPSIEYTITGTEPISRTVPLEGLVVNREKQELEIQAWLTQEVGAGEIIEYFVHMANDTGPSRTFAVMAFLDYEQIPLDGAEQWVAYVSLPTGTRAVLPGNLVAPQEMGVHEFMVVWAYDPYHMLEEPPQGPERQLTEFADMIESSIRIAIVVEE